MPPREISGSRAGPQQGVSSPVDDAHAPFAELGLEHILPELSGRTNPLVQPVDDK